MSAILGRSTYPSQPYGDASPAQLNGAAQPNGTGAQGPPAARNDSDNHSLTQDQQNSKDDKARNKAKEDLVQSWMDRLQLISVITTFFAATTSQLLSITTPQGPGSSSSPGLSIANAALTGSLIMESFSAVVAFVGAFVLVRYKVREATKDEAEKDQEKHGAKTWSTGPHLEQEQWGLLRPLHRSKGPPVVLLERAHLISVWTAFGGFFLGAVGTLAYAWAMQVVAVGAFSSATMGLCLVISVVVGLWPEPK